MVLNIGVACPRHHVEDYPSAIDPATGGCRNITGQNNFDGTVTIYAVTSTISPNGDTGADPNKLVKVTDRVSDTTLPTGHDWLGHFTTIRSARAREVLRGVAFDSGETTTAGKQPARNDGKHEVFNSGRGRASSRLRLFSHRTLHLHAVGAWSDRTWPS